MALFRGFACTSRAISSTAAGAITTVKLVTRSCGALNCLSSHTYDRLRDLGVEVSTTCGTLFELFNDLGTPDGKVAEAIATGQDLAPVA
ncbi:MAG: hypothetical protein JO179_21465 [Solirubrobacterales bacterium]|nr:hypothetical protein [Solirubrobacterales bacterium]